MKQRSLGYPDPYAAPVSRAPSVPDSSSSAQAADAVRPHVRKLEQLVLDVVRKAPDGMTDREIQDALGMRGDTERPRRVWLVANGFLENRDNKQRKTPDTGRMAAVWYWTGKREADA